MDTGIVVTLALFALGVAAAAGILMQRVNDHERRLAALERMHEDVLAALRDVTNALRARPR